MTRPIQLEFIFVDNDSDDNKIWLGLSADGNAYKINHINDVPVMDFIFEHGTTRYNGYLSSSNITGWYNFKTEA